MFVLFATKPLNDGTNGFRFNFAGVKGLTRKRKIERRPFKIDTKGCMLGLHLGKRSVYIERKANRDTQRRLRHFAG
jgi:hypothetical protein